MINLITLVALSFLSFSINSSSLDMQNKENNAEQYSQTKDTEYLKPGSDGGNSKPNSKTGSDGGNSKP